MKKVILLTFLLLFACSRVSVPKDIKDILQKNCNSCHNWSNFTKIKSKSKDKWQDILQRMIRKGARLNNDEYKKLLDYFTSR